MHPQGFPTKVCGGMFETAPAPAVFPGSSVWIGGGGQLRATKGLPLPIGKRAAGVVEARAYVAGVGAFYLFVNGERVGGNLMDPPQAQLLTSLTP